MKKIGVKLFALLTALLLCSLIGGCGKETKKETGLTDFVIEVQEDRDPVVLQFTDTQIIDAAQVRTEDRLNDTLQTYWATDQVEERCYDYLAEIIEETKPDLILITGNMVYGEFDDSGEALLSFIRFMEDFEIPWAPVFGTHDNESEKGVDWQCERFENAEYCLFKQRELTGNGNYTVGIKQGNELKRVFFMMDSNGCRDVSMESLENGHTTPTAGFGEDQIDWYTETAKRIKEQVPNAKISFAFHLELHAFIDAYEKYGFANGTTESNPINIDLAVDKAEGDFGYLGSDLKDRWDNDDDVWNSLKELGVDSIFVGHEHCNSASVVYEGIRCQFGQKSSAYDRINYVDADGTIVGSYYEELTPLVGGTVIPLSAEDGAIKTPYIYLCKTAGGDVFTAIGEGEQKDATEYVDFVVEVEEGKNPVVLQLTDTQIIDAAQERAEDRLDEPLQSYWATNQVEERCYNYLIETINATKPDLILITGDVIYGEFDDNGSVLKSFVKFMDSFGIPWAPVFGNHDNESNMGVDWQCEQFENAKYCLFKQRELTGNGNYTVGIKQGNALKRVFFMLDSNGCGNISEESKSNGHTTSTVGFGTDQIKWYTNTARQIKKLSPNTKFSFAFHIQLQVFANAYEKYGFNDINTETKPINIDILLDKAEGDFGYLGRNLKGPWDMDYTVWNGLKSLGVDSIFVGHEHCNSASVVYDGIRCQFGQKSSTYDRANYVDANGNIKGSYYEQSMPLVGGTVIPLSAENGAIIEPYIYLCE